MRKGTALNVVEKLATVNEYISEGIVQDDYQIEGIEQALVGYDDIVAGDGCQ
jgi:hypothetical protein